MTSTPVRSDAAAVQLAVRAAIARIGPGVVGIACSGGADSTALAHAAIDAVGASNVVVLVIDHALQPHSAHVSARVAEWARARGAAAIVRRVAVARRASVEAAAREARYAALSELVEELGLVAILMGHTARDQAETVLMRIVRGTGPAGLAGIPAVRGPFVRPLLAVSRTAVEAYVAAHALPVWDDPMNTDEAIARVRMRERVLPTLRDENPRLDAALVRLAASAAEWLDVLDGLARPFARRPIACGELATQPPAVRKRALALVLEELGLGYEAAHLDQLDELITRPAQGQVAIDLTGGRAVRTYDELRIETAPESGSVAGLIAPPGPYALRTWRPGDRMRPARLHGRSRKLSDLFIDAKVPRAQRPLARVVVRTTDDGIVWAEHVGLAYGEPVDLLPKPA